MTKKIDGAVLLQESKESVKAKQKAENSERNQQRNLCLKTIGLTLLCVFVVEGSFALGTHF